MCVCIGLDWSLCNVVTLELIEFCAPSSLSRQSANIFEINCSSTVDRMFCFFVSPLRPRFDLISQWNVIGWTYMYTIMIYLESRVRLSKRTWRYFGDHGTGTIHSANSVSGHLIEAYRSMSFSNVLLFFVVYWWRLTFVWIFHLPKLLFSDSWLFKKIFSMVLNYKMVLIHIIPSNSICNFL